MQPFTLILVRHGHVEGISPERFRGQTDLPLTDLGVREANLTAQYISTQWSADAIYASPLQRTMNTAEAIAKKQNLKVQPLPQLIDVNYGNWQGRAVDEVQSSESELYEVWKKHPQYAVIENGETLAEVQARVVRALDHMRKNNPAGTVIAVGHDATIRLFLNLAMGLSLRDYWTLKQDPCAINVLQFVGHDCRIQSINQTGHLIEVLASQAH
jgi:probable phosphoglycerate mutase